MTNVSNSQAAFRFTNFVIVESHLVLRAEGETELSIDITPAGRVDAASGVFYLDTEVKITDRDVSDEQFAIKVLCEARFEFSNLEDAALQNYFTVNAPAIVFPYIRSYIASLTAQSGRNTILLPTFNLSGLSNVLRGNIEALKNKP